jgi:hypothetical protein
VLPTATDIVDTMLDKLYAKIPLAENNAGRRIFQKTFEIN